MNIGNITISYYTNFVQLSIKNKINLIFIKIEKE